LAGVWNPGNGKKRDPGNGVDWLTALCGFTPGVAGGGSVFSRCSAGRCSRGAQTLTLLKTQISDFPIVPCLRQTSDLSHPVQDISPKVTPYLKLEWNRSKLFLSLINWKKLGKIRLAMSFLGNVTIPVSSGNFPVKVRWGRAPLPTP